MWVVRVEARAGLYGCGGRGFTESDGLIKRGDEEWGAGVSRQALGGGRVDAKAKKRR